MRICLVLLYLASIIPLRAQSLSDSLYTSQTLEVYFPSGQWQLDAAAKLTLDSVVAVFKKLEGSYTTRITAHTDSVGATAFNDNLARKRAQSVAGYLGSNGVPTAVISVASFGERDPAASNATEAGRQRNRRATVEVGRVVPMATYAGRVTDKKTGEGIEATLYFRSKTRADSTQTDTAGYYSLQLPKDTVVHVEVVAKDYMFESMAFRVLGSPELYARYKVSPNIVLPRAVPGEKAVMRNLYFVGGEAVLVRASYSELPKVLRFMRLNPELHIEIAGHVNKPYKDDDPALNRRPANMTKAEYVMSKCENWEKKLSENRAKVVYDFLVKNGIPADRMRYKGYNNSEMLFPHAEKNEEMEQNRRVEIRIIE